ncbi:MULTISPECIES: flagellar basal body P-ring formation chaperone FlgA [unclassified Hyphomonas]|jgi:flagella basal body P-ring formation protein FlgA|uniref:flagellar basal body P-ring formation chaperone FlgA n=1 Tax=unclassified Hyphomonas TaxID=2630699 RepID=UPI00068FB01F|nr:MULTISPECIES: flagellar basal body P-ring formation chaperone FlgA [unclassified Hyphomonas]MAN92294.1 flagella basal body P-ring formation protein FlgA [Hyphomonadaceae bacterium]MAA82264.1 flagella basal body P-ring formation protein FlgA [Hyphomonas sp.]MAL44691.1 flagella basal body P-ring formation protein FlgA [Hyphomonas sp.]MAX84089.1 flagella basal body P-ring formation protein FlgA [Hyphomonas sp.]MDF1807263.1 flagellar basal body P-ring formation chaperone FlgA [Hyphomonas sp.]|tara:strand:+ start:47944 stop:48351 length:408 start_codon:yes stop_codon:yes gene_type:complete
MIPAIALGLGLAAQMLGGSSLVVKEVIRAGDTVTAANISTETGALVDTDNPLLGREVRRTVYVGQELSMDDTRPARLVRRNQLVTVKFVSGALEITTTGRAMGEATEDEAVAILNLNSKKIVNGIVQKDGWVLVQ